VARRVVGLGDARKEVAAIGKLYNELYAKPLGPLREADVAGRRAAVHQRIETEGNSKVFTAMDTLITIICIIL